MLDMLKDNLCRRILEMSYMPVYRTAGVLGLVRLPSFREKLKFSESITLFYVLPCRI